MKLNNKGYMLVEIILASALAFGLAFFIIDLTIKLKNKNDDLMVETLMNTDRTIINNKLMSYAKDEEGSFDCEKLTIEENVIKYNGTIINVVNDYGNIESDKKECSTNNGKISIKIPITVPQMPDKEYDIVFDYKYLNNIKYKCNYEGSEYLINYTGDCIYEEEENNNWKIKFLTSGTLIVTSNLEIDVFLVGGGGGGDYRTGGGGGYTNTQKNLSISSGNKYDIVIGEGSWCPGSGASSSAFGYSADGGKSSSRLHYTAGNESGICIDQKLTWTGGAGGSGGGANAPGGTDGGNGSANTSDTITSETEACAIINEYYCTKCPLPVNYYNSGKGSGHTTREFEEPDGQLYASGGGTNISGGANTGNGSYGNGSWGGSGIVIIRNKR